MQQSSEWRTLAEMTDAGRDDPPTVETLADLQAGLLDDETAARLRQQIRTDPRAQQTLEALNRVRREVAALGAESLPPAAAPVTGAAPAHSVRRGHLPRPTRLTVAAIGLAAVAVAAWLGVTALLTPPTPLPSRPTTIQHITVSRPPASIPLSDAQIVALLDRAPDLGPLSDP